MVRSRSIKYLLIAFLAIIGIYTHDSSIIKRAPDTTPFPSKLTVRLYDAANVSAKQVLASKRNHNSVYKTFSKKKVKVRYRPGTTQFKTDDYRIPYAVAYFPVIKEYTTTNQFAEDLFYLSFSLRGPPSLLV